MGEECIYPARPPIPQPAPFPDADPHMYPVLSGPSAVYPAEAGVRPVWTGDGRQYVPPDPEPEEDTEGSPPPIITSMETWEAWEEAWYPRSPRMFARTARSVGWDVRIAFSRGYVAGAKAGTWELRDRIGVWMNGYGKRAAVFWERNPEAEFTAKKLESGKIRPGEIPSGMEWSTAGTSIRYGAGMGYTYASHTDLLEWVQLKGAVLPSWYEAIKIWVMAHDENAKRKARGRAQEAADDLERAARER